MDPSSAPRHPVLRYLAVVRAARDFGLDPEHLDPLTVHFAPAPGSIDHFADAVTAALLGQR
jgi:hypothetical protein